MKHTKVILAMLVLLALFVTTYSQGSFQTKTISLNKNAFDQSLIGAVAPNVMGYQYVLIKDGRIVSEKFGGKARNGSDGNMNMTATTPVNVGSLQKFVTGTTMINLFEKPGPKTDSGYKNGGFKQNLDKPIWGEFPQVWLKLIPGPTQSGNTVRSIDFRQLLQHRSGFDDEYEKNRTVIGFLSEGFNPAQYDKREYSNINFVLAGYLLPLIERHNLNYDLDIATNNLSTAEADKYVRGQLGKRMDEIFNERIFSKMTPKINPSCDAKNELKNTAAYGYDSKTDTKGIITSSIETQGHCAGQGGYFYSARDFANYVAHFSNSELIVSKAARDFMFSDTMKDPDDRVVWTVATGDNWMKAKFNMPFVAWSNGITNGTKTVLVRLPQNHYLILFANSDDLSVGQLYNAGVAAFKAGMAHNFDV
jgi:CubicO group peptidase (beta-lactamase class C family)